MTLEKKINNDLTHAIKSKDELRVSCLRMLKTAIKNKCIEKSDDLKDDEIQAIISSMIRKGQEAAKEFKNGNREELAEKEEKEVKIFYEYLPKQLSDEEIEQVISSTITEISAEGVKDMGKVMKTAMGKMAGKAPGKVVSEIARRLLS